MRSGLICRSGAIAGRMACILAAALLACASSAHSQVIGEGGFPVKGDGVSGESFSLSCPPRLDARAGESVLLSCSATAVLEEGIRYEWESLSGDGLHLLSNANERSPLFTAPLSGESAEYVYRLTATAPGVYETATVTVVVGGVSGGSVQDRSKSPVAQEECDPFMVPEGLGEGCAEDKGPAPFGFDPESEGEFLFPEAPGLPDRPSGPVRSGGFDRQTPPRLKCPVAAFLEELETGVIECQVSDAAGEEFLEYSWEPVGSTTRDYLDNPRLIPEDAPNPSVVASEAPVYETLESFHSGETTFRYRYRLTATSRATGLSSSSEVEVYVSSSRPSVYCPKEVVVAEGETVSLDCEGVDPLSGRIDYDEDGASILWEWEGLWGTSMAPLAATDLSSPLFTAPLGSAGEEYHYIASMTSSASGAPRTARRRVTVRVVGGEEGGQTAVKVTAQNVTEGASGMPGQVECFVLPNVYEGDPDKRFRCKIVVTGDDQLLSVTWTWEDPYDPGMLSATNIRNPVFYVPESVSATTRFDFQVTAKYQLVSGYKIETLNIYAIVNNLEVVVACDDPGNVEEGDADITFSCSATYPLSGTLRWSWSPTTRLTGHTTGTPRFDVPDDVDGDKTYTYAVRVTADRADPGGETVKVKVRDADTTAPAVRCTNASIYEGSRDITLSCSVANEPAGATYGWAGTDIANRLTGTDGLAPTFAAPDDINKPGGANKDYEYTVTLTAGGVDVATEDVTVTVLEKPDITWCGVKRYTSSYTIVWEGSSVETKAWYCAESPQGAPGHNPAYMFWWSTLGDTPATAINLLQPRDVRDPIFSIPPHGTVDEDQTYEFRATISAANADDATWDWRVIVKNSKVTVTCDDPAPVDEGDMDFDFACFAIGPPGVTYTWSWSPTTRLTDRNTGTPRFNVPGDVDGDKTYTYAVRVTADNADPGEETVTVTVRVTVRDTNPLVPVVSCNDSEVYEGSSDFDLRCTVNNKPSNASYRWSGTDIANRLRDTDSLTPTFAVPVTVNADTDYDYTVTLSAAGIDDVAEDVTVTVLNKELLTLVCAPVAPVYEDTADFDLDCSASGAPVGSDYEYVWTARGSTPNTDKLSSTTIANPTFYVPDQLEATTTYEYLLTASAENAESSSARVTVTVLNHGALSVVCADPPSAYEGSENFDLDCSASGAPVGSDYEYVWTARGATANTALLIAGTDGPTPTFAVPDALDETTTYEYLLTARAENAESSSARVTVTVLNRGALAVTCAPPPLVYEGSENFDLDCSASGGPAGSDYDYYWTPRGSTPNTDLLSDTTVLTPTFYVPDALDETTTYEYLLTVSADNAEDATAEVTVTVLNRAPLSVVCTYPGSIYEGSADFELDCSASGAPSGSDYTYVWTARENTQDTALLSAADIASPMFLVPEAVDEDETYEYLLTVSAANAEDASAEVTVTVLNKGALALVCTDAYEVYEGSEDVTLDCSASGAPSGSDYAYAWTARGNTSDTSLLSTADIASPVFYVPDEVGEDETHEYTLTVNAANAESASAEVTVTVLNRAPLAFVDDSISGRVYVFTVGESIADILLPQATGGLSPYTYTLAPALPEGLELDDPTRTISGTPLQVSPRSEYTWQVVDANAETVQIAFFIEVVPAADTTSPPVAESSPEAAEPPSLESLSLGVTVSASSLDFGVQSAETQVSLDPMTDQISTYVSGPYHGGRMMLALDGSAEVDESGNMALSIELASPVVLRREGGIEASSIVLSPNWSLGESCEQLSSQTIGGLYTEVTLSEDACRLLRFGGELDLTGVPSGRYAGSMDVILRSGESEETHSVEVDVTVIPAQQVITIGPGGVRFSTSRELPVSLSEEQNLSIYPDVAFLTEEKPNGVFELSNPSLIPLEISVSARFGYTEATENGREVVVEDISESHLGDLSQVVDIHPGVLVLMPGEKGLVRYGMQEGALTAMAEKGYTAFFDVVSEPRQYVRSDQMPEEVTGEKTARVTMRVPGVYVPGEGASQLRATLLSISFVDPMSATFLLETLDHPFVGEVVAYDGDGRELGRRETLVYTRSRVRVPLDRMPEEETVFLRFAPRGSGRVPEPASVEWDAPRRDIGAAEDKDRATTTKTLARKP